jgi:hypothetical protein
VSAQRVGHSTTILASSSESAPINPSLRPDVNAVRATFAAKGIELTVEPLGGEAAMASALDPSADWPTVITFIVGSES